MDKHDTSWGHVADWYDHLIEDNQSYQQQVILPNLMRVGAFQKNHVVLDVGCGQGFFTNIFAAHAGSVVGVDIASELIDIARKGAPLNARFVITPAERLNFLQSDSIDIATAILSLQNIEHLHGVIKECGRVLRMRGRFLIVMNHPTFRIPKFSQWGWDEQKNTQYRRIDRYLSELKTKIRMSPGENPDAYTITFHRPLQFYFKLLCKNGFAVRRLEEWVSSKKSQPGPRKIGEDRARSEIPLFLFLEAVKIE